MNTDKILAESIAKDYAPKDNSKIVALKKLDNRAKLPAILFAYACGIVSALVFGTGMCLAMQVIGNSMVAHITIVFVRAFTEISKGYIFLYKWELEAKSWQPHRPLTANTVKSINKAAVIKHLNT